jgi:hypothetical protein
MPKVGDYSNAYKNHDILAMETLMWRALNSLRDSNVSPKLKTSEEQKVEATPWLAALRGVKGCAGALGWD